MTKKYCKKSSLQSVADEVKTRKGSSSNIQGNNIASDISDLVIPAQRGAPETVLTASRTSKTIQRGKYTGGSVSVVPQNATATIQANGAYVPIESGKTLASVKVPSIDNYTVIGGTVTKSASWSPITFEGLPFVPLGFAICVTSYKSSTTAKTNTIMNIACVQGGELYGTIASINSSTGVPGKVTAANISWGTDSVTVSDITYQKSGNTYTSAIFYPSVYTYIVWGK